MKGHTYHENIAHKPKINSNELLQVNDNEMATLSIPSQSVAENNT